MKFDDEIKNCSSECVAIYPPIFEISDQKKRDIFLAQTREVKEVLDKQM